MKPQQQQLKIDIAGDQAEGIYSNLALIVHSPSEIIVDFARMMPGMQKGKVFSRIIMTPPHAKMLLKTLEQNIKKFESQFGEIKIHGQESKNIGFNAEKSEKK